MPLSEQTRKELSALRQGVELPGEYTHFMVHAYSITVAMMNLDRLQELMVNSYCFNLRNESRISSFYSRHWKGGEFMHKSVSCLFDIKPHGRAWRSGG
jgi:hypothetical protein